MAKLADDDGGIWRIVISEPLDVDLFVLPRTHLALLLGVSF